MGPRKYWTIKEYDGSSLVSEWEFPKGKMSQKRVELLLRLLISRHLSSEEIIREVVKRDGLLEVKQHSSPTEKFLLMCGVDPHVTAEVTTHEG